METTVLTVLIPALLLACSTAPSSRGQGEEQKDHTITVSIDGSPCFARPVTAKVIYRNNGDAPWTLNTPTQSRGASILYRVVGTEGIPSGYPLGHGEALISYDQQGGRIVSMTAPPRIPLTIEPGQSHVFTVPLERGWMGYLIPANWTVWIKDREQKLESNRLEFPLRFTHDSVTACLESASNTKKRGSERAWHAEWLQKIMPGLELKWRPENPSPEGIARRNAEIEKKLQEFKLLLEDPKNAEVIKTAIARINQEAGLPPIADEKPVEAPAPEADDKGGK